MILTIDTTQPKKVVVGLKDQNSKIDEIIEVQKHGSQVLLPMIDQIIKKNKMKIGDIKGIEVNVGPGSFTGTRVGVAVANALGFALDIPVNSKKGKIVLPVYEKSKFD